MSPEIQSLADKAGVKLFDYQMQAMLEASLMAGRTQRLCLYYKTGAGKSLTALGCMILWGWHEVVVVAPPSTHDMWEALGRKLGIRVYAMSHARFRMKDTKLSRTCPVIADEMHLFGGHGGKGWKKLDTLGMHLQAPMVLASATPNYNDAERCYCIQHILDPHRDQGWVPRVHLPQLHDGAEPVRADAQGDRVPELPGCGRVPGRHAGGEVPAG